MKFFPLFFLLPLFLCFSITIHANESLNLITSTCKTSAKSDPNIKFDFCTTSLQAVPTSRGATLSGLGLISINLILHNVTDTRLQINRLIRNKKLDPYVRQCLGDCFELYSEAIDSAKQGMDYYKAKRFVDANIKISSVMDDVSSCEDGFKEKKGVVSPLTKRNDFVPAFGRCAFCYEYDQNNLMPWYYNN